MTLAELDDSLPNGLHDAYLLDLRISFVEALAELWVDLLISLPDTETEYAEAVITLSKLQAIVIDGPQEVTQELRRLQIDSFETTDEYYPALSKFPRGIRNNFHSIYVFEPWNSYIHVAAQSAQIQWR